MEQEELIAKLGWSSELVEILWACAAQSILPKEIIQHLSRCKAPLFENMQKEDVLHLHELAVIARHENKVDILQSETYWGLCQFVKRNHPVLPGNVRVCMDSIVSCYPSGYVQQEVFTREGFRVHCALLQTVNGTLVAWPTGVSVELSVAEMASFKHNGYQPLAVLVLSQAWFDLSQGMRGSVVMKSKALSACGWDVHVISCVEYERAADKENFLRSELDNRVH